MAQASQVLDNRPENKLGLTSNLALEQYSNTNLPPIDISRKEATQNKLIRSEFASDKLQMTKSPMLQPTNKQALSVIPEQQQRNFPEQHQRNFAPNLPNQYSRPPPPKKEGMFSFLTRKEKPSYPPAYNRQIDQYPQNYPTAQKYPPPGPQQEPYQKYSPAGPSQGPYSQKYIPGPAQDIYSQKYLPKEPLQSQPDPFLQRNPPTGAFSQQDPHSQKYPSQREIRANSDPRQGEFPVKDYRTGDYKFYSTVKQAIPQNYPKTGFEKLMSCNALTMRPIFNVEDTASCMTTMNTFYIYPGVHSREQYSIEPMFVVRENTNSCAKFCLTTDCRPFEILVSHDFEGVKEFLHLQRPCNVNCCCIGRPEMVIDYTEEGLNHSFDLGGIFHPFVLCDYELEAFDNRGQTLFVITAERCACNIYCCFGCDSCNKSAFKVKDMYENVLGAIEIGTHYQTCIPGTHECDYFSVTFPPFLGPNERTLLLSAMIFISTRLFSRGLGTQTSLE